MKQLRSWQTRLPAFIGSSTFFWGVVVFLVLEAIWIALSGLYPMAFDEDFHLGVIRLYADHMSPFWQAQPDGGNAFGAVARDPSYLFHYLMSFPYRFISLFTDNQSVQVLFLRALNIAMFTAGLPLYWRLLLRTGASKAVVHLCFAVFALIPIVPLLAAQINYDNLILPLTALTLLAALNVVESLRRTKRLDMKLLLGLIGLTLLASVVKYAFLPILIVVFGYVLIGLGRYYKWSPGRVAAEARNGLKVINVPMRIALAILLLISVGLFVERYGVNLAKYHKPVPDCGQVLSVESCSAYGPWIRDYNYSLDKGSVDIPHGIAKPLTFTADWFYGMWLRTFFAVDGPTTGFETRSPLILPGLGAIVFGVLGSAMFLASLKPIRQRYKIEVLSLFVVTSAFYVLVLWQDQFQKFEHTGRAVAINGRYLLPVMLLILVLLAIGVNEFFGNRLKLKVVAAGVVLLCLFWGGGALTYILRSNDTWYWHSQPVYNLNHAVQKTIGPLVPGYRMPTQFMH